MQAERDITQLEAKFAELDPSPSDTGTVEMIVARPAVDERNIVETVELDTVEGLVGDNWKARGSRHTDDGSAMIEAQITLMNSRVIDLLAGEKTRWSLAGDQFFVDYDLSDENLPAGQRIQLGTAVLEISELPHTGCAKFTERFGSGAIRFVNSPAGRAARHRGLNARVITNGTVNTGDTISKID